MPRTRCRPCPTQAKVLTPVATHCPECGHLLRTTRCKYRTVTTLDGVTRLTLRIRHCPNPDCSCYHRPHHPEAESLLALPHHEFGLDVLALIGRLRHAEHRSVPEIHQGLTRRGVVIALRSVTNLLDRYDELRALATADRDRLHALLRKQRRVVLAIDGLRPDVGHEVLWVLRDLLSGEVLLARSLLSATIKDLKGLLTEVRQALPVPIKGVVSDGQDTIRKAIAQALPGVPPQQCHFHYLREAAKPIYEADRHAKKELKKRVRGVRAIERKVENAQDEQAEVVRGYCAAVRSALTDDGRLGSEVAGATGADRGEPGPGGEQGRATAQGVGKAAAAVASRLGGDGGVVVAGAGHLPLGQAGGAAVGEEGEEVGQGRASRTVRP